jgi:glucose/mannose-6-phosphate isomerase
MYSVDRDNFKQYLLNFPQQISESQKIFLKDTPPINNSIKNIIYLGMGGSAIAGDIINEVLYDDLAVPFQIVRGYEIPGYCSESTLILASSYSGNTEETLAAVKKAEKTGAQVIAITSGGEMLKLAKKNKWPVLLMPGGIPPRQAFGYLFFLAYQLVLLTLGKEMSAQEFDSIVHFSESIVQISDELHVEGRAFTKDLAIRLKNKIPIIYSPSPYLASVATRWKNQFQENSKSMAFSNVIPEMNHNEIVGWEMASLNVDDFMVLFLEDEKLNPRIEKRFQLTKKIIHDRETIVAEVYAEGKTLLAKVISLVIKGDWISYYLALLYERNPAKIVNIDYLKSELK